MSTNARRAGWIITVLVTLFLGFDIVTHLFRVEAVMDFNDKVGAPGWFPVVCGAVLGLSLIAYHVPATRAMGTILITAYLGGAVTVNLVFEQPASTRSSRSPPVSSSGPAPGRGTSGCVAWSPRDLA